jgi:hypothetical protein
MKPILGGIIVVRKGVLDYSMSQITQIVETIMEAFGLIHIRVKY